MTGPMQQGFTVHPDKPRTVLMCDGDNVTQMILLAENLQARNDAEWKPLVLVNCESPLPLRMRPSTIIVNGMPNGVIAALARLDEQGIPSRLSSRTDLPGCHDGPITELAEAWLATLNRDTLTQVEVFACGPVALHVAIAHIARRFGVSCQVAMDSLIARTHQ